ncbi:hypothetical protein GN244_ATG02485 [Phytophthora infestans]|uniref:Secreted RxLR effector peptide protein n=1 Tax=Phytophthora infestans TaxID=4787 RepID=A0A833SBM7_PHYIN|nr:hypothetical protein GN244_ATG02485 [Phytophthora infestans]KAF4149896.1 hypothetical protein GN958_ATG00835 [Phytophthora infestans]
MQLYSIAFLAAAALLVNVEKATCSDLTTADHPTALRFFVDHHNAVAPKRSLRRYDERSTKREQ